MWKRFITPYMVVSSQVRILSWLRWATRWLRVKRMNNVPVMTNGIVWDNNTVRFTKRALIRKESPQLNLLRLCKAKSKQSSGGIGRRWDLKILEVRWITRILWRFGSFLDYSGYLIPGSTVTTIGEFGISHEWGCKIRETYNGGVPKTQKRDIWVIIS